MPPETERKKKAKTAQSLSSAGADPTSPLESAPLNFSTLKEALVTLRIALLWVCLIVASSIDALMVPQAAADLGMSEAAEPLATLLFLVGLGVVCLVGVALSEPFLKV